MDCTKTEDHRQVETISLLESLNQEWIKLPLEIMQDVGPAVQTLGGLLKVTNKETFSAVRVIAENARLPVAKVRRHVAALDSAGWINHRGREKTRRGWLRRTSTIALTKQTRDHLEPYGVLPWWACCNVRKVGKLPWSAKAVLSVVMARLMNLKSAAEQQEGCMSNEIYCRTEDKVNNDEDGDPDDDGYRATVRRGVADEVSEELIGAIENLGGEDRFRFSLACLVKQTGLTRESVVAAKRWLHHHKVFVWSGGMEENGVAVTDLLAPNWAFRVIVTPASEGKVWIDFGHGTG